MVKLSQSQYSHTPMFPPVLRNVKVIKITFKCQLTMGNILPETALLYETFEQTKTFLHYWNPL